MRIGIVTDSKPTGVLPGMVVFLAGVAAVAIVVHDVASAVDTLSGRDLPPRCGGHASRRQEENRMQRVIRIVTTTASCIMRLGLELRELIEPAGQPR